VTDSQRRRSQSVRVAGNRTAAISGRLNGLVISEGASSHENKIRRRDSEFCSLSSGVPKRTLRSDVRQAQMNVGQLFCSRHRAGRHGRHTKFASFILRPSSSRTLSCPAEALISKYRARVSFVVWIVECDRNRVFGGSGLPMTATACVQFLDS
jgi:hypothetical protein